MMIEGEWWFWDEREEIEGRKRSDQEKRSSGEGEKRAWWSGGLDRWEERRKGRGAETYGWRGR